jgi:hypothetical protein
MRTANIIKTAVWMALLAGMSAAGIKYVAVVETGVDERSGASSSLNAAEVALITAELRRVAVENLPRDKYNVMTSETVQSMGGAVLEECAEENCIITLGSRIGADYIVRGTVSKFQNMLTLSVEMYETENGTLVASFSPIRSESAVELLEKGATACGEMFRKFAGTQRQTAVKTQSTGGYTANAYNDNQSWNQYEDFTEGQRWMTFGLNILPGGLGSFLIMKDKGGGRFLVGANLVAITGVILSSGNVFNANSVSALETGMFVCGFVGAGLFNIFHSVTYHKPNPKSAHANNFKPYDGLKLAILPTESGDYKVYARYDYTF